VECCRRDSDGVVFGAGVARRCPGMDRRGGEGLPGTIGPPVTWFSGRENPAFRLRVSGGRRFSMLRAAPPPLRRWGAPKDGDSVAGDGTPGRARALGRTRHPSSADRWDLQPLGRGEWQAGTDWRRVPGAQEPRALVSMSHREHRPCVNEMESSSLVLQPRDGKLASGVLMITTHVNLGARFATGPVVMEATGRGTSERLTAAGTSAGRGKGLEPSIRLGGATR